MPDMRVPPKIALLAACLGAVIALLFGLRTREPDAAYASDVSSTSDTRPEDRVSDGRMDVRPRAASPHQPTSSSRGIEPELDTAEDVETAEALEHFAARIEIARAYMPDLEAEAFAASTTATLRTRIEALEAEGNEAELDILRGEARTGVCSSSVPEQEKPYYVELARALSMPVDTLCEH